MQENTVWTGGILSRVAAPILPTDDTREAGKNVTLAVALSVSLLAALIIAAVVIKCVKRKVWMHY